MNRKFWGGVTLVAASGFLAREFVVWALGKIFDGVSSGIHLGMTFVSLSWQNALAALLAVAGATILLWPRPKTKVEPKRNPSPQLFRSGIAIINDVRRHRATKWFNRELVGPIADLAMAGRAVLLSFEKAGFVVPDFSGVYVENEAVGMEAYFSVLVPFLGRGHLDEARDLSGEASRHAVETATAFNPHAWFQNNV